MDYLDSSKRINLADMIDTGGSYPKSVPTLPEYTIKISDEIETGGFKRGYGEMTTVIDRVYDYISKKQVTSVTELSENLGIRKGQVEGLIEILEMSHLIKVRYSVVPNGKIEVLVTNREYKAKDVSHEERVKSLRNIVTKDADRLESAISSMEHHLKMWSAEAEEASKNGGLGQETTTLVSQESIKLENNLEQVRSGMNARINSIKKRLSDMRLKLNSPSGIGNEKELSKESKAGNGIFGIKNPFNF